MGNEKAQARTLVCFFLFVFSSFSFCLCMCGNDQGFVHFLHIDAKSPPAFPKYKWTNIRRGEQKILNKYNKFG